MKHVSDQEREQAIAMFDAGCSVRSIAKELHRSPTTVSKIVRATGRYPATEQTERASLLNSRRACTRWMDEIEGLLTDISALRERAWQEHLERVRDRAHGTTTVALPEPPLGDQLAAYSAIESAARTVRTLSKKMDASMARQPFEYAPGPVEKLASELEHLTPHRSAEHPPVD